MELPEAQEIIKNMDVDFRKWFETNPWRKSSKAKGEFLEWIKRIQEAQIVIDAHIAWNYGVKGILTDNENDGCLIADKILNQNKFKIPPSLQGYGIIHGLKPKGKHYISS